MKKALVAIAIAILIIGTSWNGYAASSATTTPNDLVADSAARQAHAPVGNVKKVVTISITAAADGTVTPIVIDAGTNNIVGQFLYSAEINPGTPAPQANYSIDLTSPYGLAITGTLLHGLSATVTQFEIITTGRTNKGFYIVHGNLTLTMSSNNVNGAKVDVILTFLAN